MVEEKLPKEISAKKLELQIFEDVINERNINAQYLSNLQNQVKLFSAYFCVRSHMILISNYS